MTEPRSEGVVDEEKIRFDISTCHHAYKMLDRAENLWCDDCVIRAIDIVAGQLLQQPKTVTREEYQAIIKEAQDFWIHIHPMEIENIVFQVVTRLGIEVKE